MEPYTKEGIKKAESEQLQNGQNNSSATTSSSHQPIQVDIKKNMKRKRCLGGSRRVTRFLQSSIIIDFDIKVSLSDRNFSTLVDPPLKMQ